MTPNVAVVIPCRNAAATIVQAVKSCLQPEVVEVVVVDDHSTDGSREAVRAAWPVYRRIRTITLADDLGEASAVNQGIYAARRGNKWSSIEYIALQHADDFSDRERFARQLRLAKPRRVVGCWATGINGPDLVWSGSAAQCHAAFLGKSTPIPCPTALMPVQLALDFPWDPTHDPETADYEVFGRMLDACVEFVAVPQRLYNYRWRAGDPSRKAGEGDSRDRVLARHQSLDCKACRELGVLQEQHVRR